MDDTTSFRKDGLQPRYVPDLRDIALDELAQNRDGMVELVVQKVLESTDDPHRVRVATFSSAI